MQSGAYPALKTGVTGTREAGPQARALRKGSPLNSVAGGLAPGLGVRAGVARGKVGARIGAVLGDTGSEGIETVVLELVVQFVQKFHANDFTVRPLGAQAVRPLQAMGFQQHAAAIHIVRVERRSHAQVGHAGQGCVAQAVYQQAVVTKVMPMNNSTGITDAERALLGEWFKAGAPVP